MVWFVGVSLLGDPFCVGACLLLGICELCGRLGRGFACVFVGSWLRGMVGLGLPVVYAFSC